MDIARSLATALALLPGVAAAVQTVCTITVNSPDEKEAMRARLPPGRHEFVELVERGKPDWLASACRSHVSCDVLVVSGHFNAGDTFYSDRLANTEHLAIDELERAACSGSCPGLFSNLKEVYLFGCESLNPDATKYASSHGESGRARMRRIFAGVPSIYGFSGAAPVGSTAAAILNRYFDANGGGAFGTGAFNGRLLAAFSRNSMTRVSGSGPEQSRERALICGFHDDRVSPADKLRFVHGLLRDGDLAAHLKRIDTLLDGFTDAQRQDAAYAEVLAGLSADDAARARFLAYGRAAVEPSLRVRVIALASEFGWLTPAQREDEVVALANDLLARGLVGPGPVDLMCGMNADGALDSVADRLRGADASRVAHAALLACFGDAPARARTLQALAGGDDGEVRIAQAYLRHRPVNDGSELRPLARAVAQMPGSSAKVRALDALARLRISDREVLSGLTRTFAEARSAGVQDAIAEIFLRADYHPPDLAETLRRHRLAPARSGVVDSLLARLERNSGKASGVPINPRNAGTTGL